MAKESQNIERTGKMKFPSAFLPLLLAAALFAATPAAAQYQSHFTPATGFVNNMNVLGPITLDGTGLASTAYEIGAFCGDECRGSAFLEDFDAGWWALQTIVGNPGETITFALYDHVSGKVIEANCSTTVEFETNATIGFDSAFTIAFTSKPSHVIAVAANPATGGTATGGGTVVKDETCTVTATANEHWAFVNWTEDGEEVSTAASYAFTVEANRNLVANFRRKSLVVVTSAVSRAFTLDTREGPFESDGTETVAFSSLWHGTADSSVTLLANGEPFAEGLSGESNYVWCAVANGTNVLRHVTTGSSAEPETAVFVVRGLRPDPSATLRWKYAKNANGWFCAQVALRWHPAYADAISNMRLLFADRYEYSESRVVIETLDEEQAAFFQVPEMVKLVDSDGYCYFMNAETGDIYTEDFLRSGYKEVLNDSTAMEDPNYLNGKQVGSSSTFASQNNDDTHTYFDENGVLTSEGTCFQTPCIVDGHTVTGQLATTRGLRLAYLVDPATVAAPLEPTVTFMETRDGFSPIDPSDLADLPADAGTTYRVSPIDLSGFANLAAGDRAVFGVSDETMASPLASVPKAERKICLRVVNRQLQTVDFVHNKIAWLAWEEGGRTNYLPLVGSWASSETEAGQSDPQPGASFAAPLPQPAPAKSLNLSESFGLPLAAVATAEVTCRIASMGFGADGSVEGTFEIAAEDAGRVVAESGELTPGVKLAVLGAASLGGAFEPLDPAACGVELLSRKPPYAFRVKAPGDNAFFKVRLEAEDVFE